MKNDYYFEENVKMILIDFCFEYFRLVFHHMAPLCHFSRENRQHFTNKTNIC